jgi:hypothetical protein
LGFGEFSGMEMSSTVARTAWESGRFRAARAGSRKLLFGCMYEDAEIELRAFQLDGRIFCIASAGCTAMKLATRHTVVAVDINPAQVVYVQKRLGGAAVQRGSAEHLQAIVRTLGPLAGWHRRRVRAFLELDHPEQQILYWRRHLDTSRFRAAFSFLFSRVVLRFSMFCRRISEAYCALEWSGASRCTPTAGIRSLMHYFSERCALHQSFLDARLKCNAPMRPIFSNASQPGASLGFLFQIFSMEQIWHTRNDYSLRCNMLPRPRR